MSRALPLLPVVPEVPDGSLRFRPITETDLPVWLRSLQDPRVRAGISWRPQSVDELRGFVGAVLPREDGPQLRFALSPPDSDVLLGSIGLHTLSLRHRSAEIAYDVLPEHWGRGIASRACAALRDWAWDLGLCRLQATVLEGNEGSLRVLSRCGFEREGLLRRYRRVDDVARDAWMLAVLAPEG